MVNPCSAPAPPVVAPLTIVGCHDCQGLPLSSCANDTHDQGSRSRLVYKDEHMLIGPVNHSNSMEFTDQCLCSNRVSGHICSCSFRSSRKGTVGRWWFTEPSINKFAGRPRALTGCRYSLGYEEPPDGSNHQVAPY